MSNKKKLILQIPDDIIKNNSYLMDTNTFAVYSYLKFLHFRNFNNEVLEIDHNKFKHKLYIADNRTLKKCFITLHKYGFIHEYIDKLPTKGKLTITFDPLPFEMKIFTQLPATIFNRIEHIGTIGLRLLFYYESFINRKGEVNKQFAFPSIETITKDLGINKETIVKFNRILSRHKLLKIEQQELKWYGEYDDLDRPLFTKYNNHYYVKLENF